MAWTIEFDDKAIKQLKKMGDAESRRIRNYLHTRIKPLDDPRQKGRPLQGPEFSGL